MHLTTDQLSLGSSTNWRWHLVFTKPRGEAMAQANLERQGYHVYFPRVQQKIVMRGRWQDSIESLFPRYLFVQLNAALQSLSPIKSTLGVSSVVRFGNDYVVVPDRVVQELVDKADPQSGLHQINIDPAFELGSTVRITSGVLAGMEGILERVDANDRVAVLLTLLGRDTRISISSRCVTPSCAA